jgi:hypothetical protein
MRGISVLILNQAAWVQDHSLPSPTGKKAEHIYISEKIY